jgi:hypothetical protein
LAIVFTLLTAVAFVLVGLWSGQAVVLFMAASVALMGVGEVLETRRIPSARAVMWIGRLGLVVAILYVLIFLLPGA